MSSSRCSAYHSQTARKYFDKHSAPNFWSLQLEELRELRAVITEYAGGECGMIHLETSFKGVGVGKSKEDASTILHRASLLTASSVSLVPCLLPLLPVFVSRVPSKEAITMMSARPFSSPTLFFISVYFSQVRQDLLPVPSSLARQLSGLIVRIQISHLGLFFLGKLIKLSLNTRYFPNAQRKIIIIVRSVVSPTRR